MPDVEFSFDWAGRRYEDLVQVAAVLIPLTGRGTDEESTISATEGLVSCWRARISRLGDLGWHPKSTALGVQYVRNCCPAFSHATTRTRPCNIQWICPFCYARDVRKKYVSFINACQEASASGNRESGGAVARRTLPSITVGGDVETENRLLSPIAGVDNDAPRSTHRFNVQVIERRSSTLVPWLPAVPSFREYELREYLWTEIRERALDRGRFDFLGGLAHSTVAATAAGWEIRRRYLLLADAADRSCIDRLCADGAEVRSHLYPDSPTIIDAVARTCRYPQELLYGNPQATAIYARVRQANRLRLSATFGILRNVTRRASRYHRDSDFANRCH